MMNFPPRSLHLAVLACLLAPPLAGCGGGTPQAPAANSHPAAPGTITPSGPASTKQPREGTIPAAAASDSQQPAVHESGTPTSSDQTAPANPGVQPPPGAAQNLPTTDGAAKAQYAGVFVYQPAAAVPPADLRGKIMRVTVSIAPSGHIEGSALIRNFTNDGHWAYSFHGQLPKAGNGVTMTLRSAELTKGSVKLELAPGATNGTVTFDSPAIQTADRQVAITRPAVKPWLANGTEKFSPQNGIVITAGAPRLLGAQAVNEPIRLTRDGSNNRWRLESTTLELGLSADLTPTGVPGVFEASIHLHYPLPLNAVKVISGFATLDVDAETGTRRLILSSHDGAATHLLLVATRD